MFSSTVTMKFVILLATILLVQNVKASRILGVVLSASYSHQVFYQQYWRELAIRGHDVVVITTDPTNDTLPNFKEISIREGYGPAKQFMDEIIESNVIKMFINNRLMDLMMDIKEYIMRLPQVQELINNKTEHFDLAIVEHFPSPAIGFKHHFKCPLIGVMSMDAMDLAHQVMGNPTHSVLYPLSTLPMDDNPSLLLRIISVLVSNLLNMGSYRTIQKIDRAARDFFGEDTPSILDLYAETDMIFINSNPVFSSVRPVTPSTISLAGGMHLKPAKPLPKDLKEFLDNAKEGAIFFSLGSNVKSNELTLEMRQTILTTLGQLPYKVLWKFEDDSLQEKTSNIHLTKWAPQQDILRHKNIKLFVTQGGLQSLEEALFLHVPVVMMPFFADQDGNAVKAKNKGMGLVVDKNNLNVEGFKAAILEVIQNPTYKDTVMRLARQIQDSPMTALERAVWWTEYVLRHKGAQHLKGPIIPFYQYFYLDILAVIGLICFVIFAILFAIGRFCLRKICLTKCGSSGIDKTKKLKKS